MLRPEQLELSFGRRAAQLASGRDLELETRARNILSTTAASLLAATVRVEWNSRMRSAAGRADYSEQLVALNPRLQEHGADEIDRTLRHELAHLLAQARAGRRRISPHGLEWRTACSDLGIPNEARCHTLPLPVHRRTARYLYRCPKCSRDFPRVRRIRRRLACLDCCRKYHGGKFFRAAQLQLVTPVDSA